MAANAAPRQTNRRLAVKLAVLTAADNVEKRVQREAQFHDQWSEATDPTSVDVLASFAASTSPEPRWILSQLGDLRGKRVLELGTGLGEAAVFFALQGAEVVATDVSSGMLSVVHRVAELHGVVVETAVSSAEDLAGFADESFDIVYGSNVLHHSVVAAAVSEARRVLRPGGIAAFIDPVAYNPVINVYRGMAARVRTEDEHPLRRADVALIQRTFARTSVRFFWLAATLVFLRFYLVDRIHPSNDRYWKRILTHEDDIRWMYRPLAAVDRLLLRLFPPLRWWCWNVAIVAHI